MQRAIGRAYQRFQGGHPRRPSSRYSLLIEIGCDLLLAGAILCVLGAFGLLAWAIYAGFDARTIFLCLGLMAAGAVLLLVWEHVAWKPFAERLSDMT